MGSHIAQRQWMDLRVGVNYNDQLTAGDRDSIIHRHRHRLAFVLALAQEPQPLVGGDVLEDSVRRLVRASIIDRDDFKLRVVDGLKCRQTSPDRLRLAVGGHQDGDARQLIVGDLVKLVRALALAPGHKAQRACNPAGR
ncbi:unannotated protein [freshwater metagenome]|uniref:Unannotated protein n=1 Tax=freshwater metagenome TaxID=449393 RepID=A0A6J5ZHW2_9ZZZZ